MDSKRSEGGILACFELEGNVGSVIMGSLGWMKR